MNLFLRLAGVGLLFALSACAVLSEPELAAIRERRVEVTTLRKMEHGEPLLTQDVIELTRRRVPQAQIEKYISKTGVRFLVTKDDSVRMRQAGVGPRVIDLMARESAKFAADYAALEREESYEPVGPLYFDPLLY